MANLINWENIARRLRSKAKGRYRLRGNASCHGMFLIPQLTAGRSLGYGQMDFEGGSVARIAHYRDPAAMILDDPITNRQP
jgi:hypothetical protein